MKFTVGGEQYELTREDVIAAVKDARIETIHKHVVEIEGEVYPPKQVFALLTERERQSFTTMEAQRVLSRLGFECRRAGSLEDGRQAWIPVDDDPIDSDPDRLARLEAAVGTLEAAVAGLHARVGALEGR